MSFRIVGSLSEFKEKANWPFYHYAEELKRRGFHPNFIEIFLRKLSREVPYGADPDQILRSFIEDHQADFALDPYNYERPENVMGYWHEYYKNKPERFKKEFGTPFNLQEFEIDDLLMESRSWGSKFYPVIDHLSHGFKMVKLTDEQAMRACGDELSVCIGGGGGSSLREEALKGERELWALQDKYDETKAIASVLIGPDGQRIIEEIRGYKNRGYIYQGYEKPIMEWIEKHPEYVDESYSMTNRDELDGDPAYDIRGFYGDDNPEDWSDEYKELVGSPRDLILEDITKINNNLSEVIDDSDFIKRIIPLILDDPYEIEKDALTVLFEEYPEFAEEAVDLFINSKNDGDEKLVEVFFENENTHDTIKDFVVSHYCDDISDEDWLPWNRKQLLIAYNYFLLPDEKTKMKAKALDFFNNYDIISGEKTFFEIDFTLTNNEKDVYIPGLYDKVSKEMEEYGALVDEDILYDFIIELNQNYLGVFKDREIVDSFIENSYVIMDGYIKNLEFLIEKVFGDKSKDFLINRILPLAEDDIVFINIIDSFKDFSSFNKFLNPGSENADYLIEQAKNDFEYVKKIFSNMPDSVREKEEFYQALSLLFSSQNQNPNLEYMLNEINNIYPLDFFKLLKSAFAIYGGFGFKQAVLNILYSIYGFQRVNEEIKNQIGDVEFEIFKRNNLIRESSLNNKMIKLLNKIDGINSSIADNIERVFKNEIYRNIKE